MDALLLTIHDLWIRAFAEISERGWIGWIMATFPLVLLGDLVYYNGTAVLTAVISRFRRGHDDYERRRHVLFLARNPRISVIIAGRNEEGCIANCIRSLLELEYPNLEIVVIDDASTDRMYQVAEPFARRGQIRLLRNKAGLGRGGRPSATNLGVRVSTGEFIISGDADTTFDRNLITAMIGPFCDPRVGVVAGNLKARNARTNFVTRMQAIEYMIGIGLGKRWSDLRGVTMQASGALGAFRREAVIAAGGWDSELAEDTDISLKILHAGYRVRFAPQAIAMTNVPETFRALRRQRYRWDRGTLRTYFHKHGSLIDPRRSRLGLVLELATLYFFQTIATLMFPFYIVVMLAFNPWTLLFVMFAAIAALMAGSTAAMTAAVWISERRRQEWPLILWAPLSPLYQEQLRWVRFLATVHELLRHNYEDRFLPDSAWRCAPRW